MLNFRINKQTTIQHKKKENILLLLIVITENT